MGRHCKELKGKVWDRAERKEIPEREGIIVKNRKYRKDGTEREKGWKNRVELEDIVKD